jgi:thiol-disulfide isomerase/thioredoxin
MVTLNEFKGKVVLVNFWASWCPPCTNEMPGFQKVFEEYETKGFSVIGVAVDDIKLQIIRELRITYPVVKTNERVTRDYGNVTSVPASFLVGKDGRIVKKINMFYPEDELRADVEMAIKARE